MIEWVEKPIKALGRVVTGKTPPTGNTEYFENGTKPFVSPKDLAWNTYYVGNTETLITGKALDKFKNQVIPEDAVLFTSLSFAFGKLGIARERCLTNQQINSIVVNRSNDHKFVYYLLQAYRPIIFSYNSGIDTPIVPKSVFESIPVRVPDLPLQRKIAAVLSAYDDLIENNTRRIALLEKMAEEIYREWFVRFRFPGYQSTEFEKGVPRGWDSVRLENAFVFTGGGTPSKNNDAFWSEGNVNWFTPSDITGAAGLFVSESAERCNEDGIARSSAKVFPAYSVMMTSRATIGAIGINTTEAATNQGFITCIPNERFPLSYLYHWLKLAKPHFELLSGGATFPELTKGTFKRIEILRPPKMVIDRFHELESPIFKQIENLLSENRVLEATRNRLLPRLISGKLSVEELDIQPPPSMHEDAFAERG